MGILALFRELALLAWLTKKSRLFWLPSSSSGLSLWDRDHLLANIIERPQYYSDFEIVASDSTEDKLSLLNVNASLTASFMSGLMSKNQARVTLKYEATTKFQELSMNHLAADKMQHPDIFKKGVATHVVTAILYGAQAFFVFDRDVSKDEDHQDIHGKLKMTIKKIPSFSIEGEGSLHMEDKNITNEEKFSCKFHGDFFLEKNPVSFQDAVQVYQSLPKLLEANRENVVPLKVWLLPLTCLSSSATTLLHEIRTELVHKAQRVLEDFIELEMRCNDAMKTTIAQQFPEIKKNRKTFKELCFDFKVEFQRTLAKKLPLVRGGDEKESVLAEILEQRHTSFNNMNLNEWMDCIEEEIYTLMSFTNKMKNTKIIPSRNDLYKEVHRAKHTVCFVFTSKKGAEPYLSALTNYLKEPAEPYHVEEAAEKPQWFSTKEVLEQMRHKAKLFIDFAEANKENNNIQFLTTSLANENTETKGTSIYHYEDGIIVTEDFEPPAEPEIGPVTHESVTVKTTCYSVEYCVSGEDEWRQETASADGDVTVSGLTPDTEYMFRCRAECSAGVAPSRKVRTTAI
ncbi:neoverrucotoxin subunit alpha isoform X2 [Lates calcarifer]|uniref:Neoverrucotoxin subunit alpha isoform X2 n=1 Tax=Lates calcarifer TaxID=8187 RepID=A0AAJ8B1D7_LATCA|nr:neoverrucotoxin subunit alpha isoform X2 [Lates calcarifer]